MKSYSHKLVVDAHKRDPKLGIYYNPKSPSKYHLTADMDRKRRSIYREALKQGLSKGEAAKKANDYRRREAKGNMNPNLIGKHKIVLGGSHMNNPAVLAHELGHSTMRNSKLGKAYELSMAYAGIPGDITSGQFARRDKASRNLYNLGHASISANAAHSGFKVAQAKAKGEKVGKWTKHKSWILPALISAPTMFEEARASGVGYNRLRKIGATKSDLKTARKQLGAAYLTYMVDPAIRMANAGISYYAGKKLGERYYRNKK